ncbi:MAG: acetolactate synthase small subunit [Candidatus Sumerlaeia bacterium]
MPEHSLQTATSYRVIDLLVENHPGVMSHITGLFARRAFNLEGILCGPVGGGRQSRMFLLVNEDARLSQVIAQLQKLQDVLSIAVREDLDHRLFHRLENLIRLSG